MEILILNGPNLNLLGTRETEIYGSGTLEELEHGLQQSFPELALRFYQSNVEGELVTALQEWQGDGIVFNPAGYSHTSVALRDAVAAIQTPVVEVHISNIYAREEFRRSSLTGGAAIGVISGLGFSGYALAIRFLIDRARQQA